MWVTKNQLFIVLFCAHWPTVALSVAVWWEGGKRWWYRYGVVRGVRVRFVWYDGSGPYRRAMALQTVNTRKQQVWRLRYSVLAPRFPRPDWADSPDDNVFGRRLLFFDFSNLPAPSECYRAKVARRLLISHKLPDNPTLSKTIVCVPILHVIL